MRTLIRWWKVHFLFAEFGAAVLIGTCFAVWAIWLGGDNPVAETLKGNRAAIYGALATIFGSLLGFTITAVSIVLGYAASDRLAVVRNSKHYPTLWKVFMATIRASGIATIVALVALILDRDTSPASILLYVCVWSTSLAVLRLVRCLWVLEQVVILVTGPAKERLGDSA
jgi:hypothetical protein